MLLEPTVLPALKCPNFCGCCREPRVVIVLCYGVLLPCGLFSRVLSSDRPDQSPKTLEWHTTVLNVIMKYVYAVPMLACFCAKEKWPLFERLLPFLLN